MYNRVLTVLFICSASLAYGQKSAFQSSDGQTSVYLNHSAAIINLADTEFSVAYVNRHSERKLFWGVQASGKASQGITTVFTADKPKIPEGGGDASFGFHDPFHLSTGDSGKFADDWLLFDAGYSRSYFYVSSVPTAIDSANHYFDKFRGIAAYNALVNGYLLVGVAAGAERRNNLNDLDQVNFETILASGPSGTQNDVVKTQSGFLGDYHQYIAAPVYTDLLFFLPPKIKVPKLGYQIGIDGFTRSDVAAFNRSADGGIGVFISEKGAPTKVVGGLSASWNDGKPKVAIIAGLNF